MGRSSNAWTEARFDRRGLSIRNGTSPGADRICGRGSDGDFIRQELQDDSSEMVWVAKSQPI